MPVTREWTRPLVVSALDASDIPREKFLLVYDGPEPTARWETDLRALGFHVETHSTYRPEPPTERLARRPRHNQMREFTCRIVDDGPLLILDDDSLVPPDVYARLSTAGTHASGVQVSRHGNELCGVYRDGRPLTEGSGVERIDYCGHFCLLTTGEMYRETAMHTPDQCYMQPIPGLVCDWDCVVGHITEGGVLWPRGRDRG